MPGADVSAIPVWAQQVGAVAGVFVATWGVQFAESRKAKKRRAEEAEPDVDGPTAQVVAATFTDKRALADLTRAVDAMNVTLLETNALMKAQAQRLHDEKVVRDELRARGIAP